MAKKEHTRKKIPTQKEVKKSFDYDTIMESNDYTFEQVITLIKLYPKKVKLIVKEILPKEEKENECESDETSKQCPFRLTAEQFAILYNKVKNKELKQEIAKSFHAYVTKKCESHVGSDEDFYFLVDSVIIENNNPFYVGVTAKTFLDNILLKWQRSPIAYKTLNYLFETIFGGWALKFYKEMVKKPEIYITSLIFTEANIREIFRNASFGITFPEKTPEARESLRKYYLVKIFGKLVNCAIDITLQIGDSDCCDEIEKKSLEQISLVKKYADLLYTIGAIDKDVRQKRHLALETKKKEIINNGRKWKKKVTK